MFPHPNALIPADIVGQIKTIPGVIALTRGVYMWDLEPDRYESVLGIDDSEVGPRRPRLTPDRRQADHRREPQHSDRQRLRNQEPRQSRRQHQGRRRRVSGRRIVDAARGGKLVRADVYMPLSVAQALATAAPQVRALYPFGADDANLVLVKVNREQLQAWSKK